MTTEPGPLAKAAKRAWERKLISQHIAEYARWKGLDVTWEKVNRNFATFELWYHGGLATGYLIRRTGVKRIPPLEMKGQWSATDSDSGTP